MNQAEVGTRRGRILSTRFWLDPKAKDLAFLRIETLMKGYGNEPILQYVHLKGTKPNFGGVRWRFVCHLLHAGVPCNRRVKKLYLPPRGECFGCRTCLELTYESAQTNDARVNKLMKNPIAPIQAINSEDSVQKLMALGIGRKRRTGSERPRMGSLPGNSMGTE